MHRTRCGFVKLYIVFLRCLIVKWIVFLPTVLNDIDYILRLPKFSQPIGEQIKQDEIGGVSCKERNLTEF